ncbi:hypothetical protein [Siphonobacter curvatus]|uniref:Uncharacterized protein n=1 Tax=Siphonobacter curvatus TaxID=2094562 RepID=A0A2S7IJS0_9BACT|nr:hypothetical protein [Siphonobacter curvatus]PQA56756.1 hypothetical protein C5O19_15555 [Siphonobacter curvatus]
MKAALLDIPFQQDPQSDLVINMGKGICEVTFQLWDLADQEIEGYTGKVSFDHGWACEYVGIETYPYSELKVRCSSEVFLWKITQSGWFHEKINQRKRAYPTWLDWDKREYHHYLIEGRNDYIQLIASSFSISSYPSST